jgi:hypothetical protein
MRLTELAEMMIEEPAEAEAEIAELVASSDVEQLTEIAREAPVHEFRLRAIEGLADIGRPEATAALIEMAEQANTGLVLGGTEQQRERELRKDRLVTAVARARGVSPPAGRSQPEVAEFIESLRY